MRERNIFKIKSYKQMLMAIVIFTLILFVGGTTYAFFNYTRTGSANTVGTGRIYFNSTQSNTLNITDMFPLTSTQAASANLNSVSIGVVGDTTYVDDGVSVTWNSPNGNGTPFVCENGNSQ